MLKYRLITALILIPIVVTAMFLLPPIGFNLITLFVCMLSAWEWGQLSGLTSSSQRTWLGILCGLLLTLMMLSVPNYKPFVTVWQAQCTLWASLAWWFLALMLVFFYPRSAVLWYASRILRLVFGILTILPFFCGVLVLRQYHYDINHSTGAWWLLYIVVLVWSADTGAYIVGRTLGYHRLAPKISPGKTWEGLLGGLITSAFVAWAFNVYSKLDAAPSTLFFCSIVAVLTSVLGDLTESMFKREAGIKDSGHLIPGHGGILDCIDSLTAAVPVFACLILLIFK